MGWGPPGNSNTWGRAREAIRTHGAGPGRQFEHMGQGQGGNSNTWGRARDAVEGEEPRRRLDRRLEEDAKAVGGRLLSVTNAIEAGT